MGCDADETVKTCSRCGNTFTEKDGNHLIDGMKTYGLAGGAYRDSPPYALCPECAAALRDWMGGHDGAGDSAVWNKDIPSDKRVRTDIPIAIFVDACGMTWDHVHYHMIPEDSVTARLSEAAGRTVRRLDLDAVVYAATDEVSFLFSDCERLLKSLDMKDGAYEDYVMSTFLQCFTRFAVRKYPKAHFKCRLFYVRPEDVQAYIRNRREICHNVAATYYAKEFLPVSDYHKKTPEEIRKVLEGKGLWGELVKNDRLYNGILTEYERWNPLHYFNEHDFNEHSRPAENGTDQGGNGKVSPAPDDEKDKKERRRNGDALFHEDFASLSADLSGGAGARNA